MIGRRTFLAGGAVALGAAMTGIAFRTGAQEASYPVTVSYTHLTLPTKA